MTGAYTRVTTKKLAYSLIFNSYTCYYYYTDDGTACVMLIYFPLIKGGPNRVTSVILVTCG